MRPERETAGSPGVRVGVTLPTFTADPSAACLAARTAEHGGLDGVFAFDHLWPMGHPGGAAQWSFAVLAAVAAATERITLGTLVARVGLFDTDDHVAMFRTLAAIAGEGRLVAGLGAGDHLSAAENTAYGLGYPGAAERLDAVATTARRLRAAGLAVWVGGSSAAARQVAHSCGDALNVWGSSPEEMADLVSQVEPSGIPLELTWGGQVLIGADEAELTSLQARYGDRPGLVAGTIEQVADHLRLLAHAGARWCVLAPLDYIERPVESIETVCRVAKAVR